MKPIPLLTAAIVMAGGSTALVSATTNGSAETNAQPTVTVESEFDTLQAEFDAADERFRAALKTATKEERRELRKASPIKTFWGRFEALGEKGDGQALLWLVNHVRDNRDIRSRDRGEVLGPLYDKLFANHSGEKWFTSVLSSLGGDTRYVGEEKTAALFEKAIESSKDENVVAAALYMAANAIGETNPEKANGYIERILADYPNTLYGTAARGMKSKPEDSEVGKNAPNFVGQTIDGFQFQLDDYKGKVVVLDFYGFW